MTKIARYIDDMPQILFWELDEFVIASFLMGIGIVAGKFLLFTAVGVTAAMVVGKLKVTRSEGYILHIAYWFGILTLRGCPPSWIRTYLE